MRKKYKPITMNNVSPLPRKLEIYPFRSLEIGENFFVPGFGSKGSLSTLANRYKKRDGLAFSVCKRIIEEDGKQVPGILVTRVE